MRTTERENEEMTNRDAKQILEHAKWHCLYGSAPVEREPEQGDFDAANLLDNLMNDRDLFVSLR